MKLKALRIENFRSFYGEQFIEFSTCDEKNTTVILAPNGYGKTNLLNAILWCFHKTFSPGFVLPNQLLNWQAEKSGRKSFHVEILFQHEGREFRISRTGGDHEAFKLWEVDDGNFVERKSGVEAFINTIFPKDLAGYFISDGEGGDLKITIKDASLPIGRSVRDILGFQVAESTLDSINKIKREITEQLRRHNVNDQLVELEAFLTDAEEKRKSLEKSIKDNTTVLEKYEEDLSQTDRELSGINVNELKELIARRKVAETKLEKSRRKLKENYSRRVNLIRNFGFAAFASKFSDNALDFIDEAEFRGRLPAPFNVQLVKDIIESSQCICGAEIHEGSVAFENIQKQIETASNPDIINRVHRARARLSAIKESSAVALDVIRENAENRNAEENNIEALKGDINDITINIERIDDRKISKLSHDRTRLKTAVSNTQMDLARYQNRLTELEEQVARKKSDRARLQALSPQAEIFFTKQEMLERAAAQISSELERVEATIYDDIKEKINDFLNKYLRHDYKIDISPGLKISLKTRDGNIVPVSKGQQAIMSFIYISSLVSLAKESLSTESSILKPGATAPLIYDAPFSNLDEQYAPDVARQLPKLVDQLVVIMYQDKGKDVLGVLQESGRLGKVYYMNAHIEGPQGSKPSTEVQVDGASYQVTNYDAPHAKVEILKAASYVD